MAMIVYTFICVNLYLVPCSHTFTCKLISFICHIRYLICVYMFVFLHSYVFIFMCRFILLCGGNKEYLSIL